MRQTIKNNPSDPLGRMAEIWPYLRPWQRTLVLTRAVFFALPGFQASQWRRYAHWVNFRAHWV